jgi:hypothetical protein
MSALPPKADIRPRDHDVCFGPKGDIAPLSRARTDLVAERGSFSALRRHFIFDQADAGRDNRAGNTTAYCLAGKSTLLVCRHASRGTELHVPVAMNGESELFAAVIAAHNRGSAQTVASGR